MGQALKEGSCCDLGVKQKVSNGDAPVVNCRLRMPSELQEDLESDEGESAKRQTKKAGDAISCRKR